MAACARPGPARPGTAIGRGQARPPPPPPHPSRSSPNRPQTGGRSRKEAARSERADGDGGGAGCRPRPRRHSPSSAGRALPLAAEEDGGRRRGEGAAVPWRGGARRTSASLPPPQVLGAAPPPPLLPTSALPAQASLQPPPPQAPGSLASWRACGTARPRSHRPAAAARERSGSHVTPLFTVRGCGLRSRRACALSACARTTASPRLRAAAVRARLRPRRAYVAPPRSGSRGRGERFVSARSRADAPRLCNGLDRAAAPSAFFCPVTGEPPPASPRSWTCIPASAGPAYFQKASGPRMHSSP